MRAITFGLCVHNAHDQSEGNCAELLTRWGWETRADQAHHLNSAVVKQLFLDRNRGDELAFSGFKGVFYDLEWLNRLLCPMTRYFQYVANRHR